MKLNGISLVKKLDWDQKNSESADEDDFISINFDSKGE
jgi:hypothetical protein